MLIRRKPPSLISMWMLDVFCCALGCVTLLWLLNTREAKLEATRAASALTDLSRMRETLAAAKAEADATQKELNSQIDELKEKLVATVRDRDDTARKLALAKSDLATMGDRLNTAATHSAEQDELLRKKQAALNELIQKLATANVSAEELSKLLRQTEKDRDAVLAKSASLEEKLNDADARLRAATIANREANDALAAMRKTGNELAAARQDSKTLQDKLDQAQAQIIDLQGDKKKLADKYDRLRIESDNKFAGIAMTGKKVVFLVDISGSMKLVDEKTPDPAKWPIVVETVAKVMQSIPDLEAFQVITFSRTAEPLFSGGFQPFRGSESVRRVTAALKDVEPVGDTNLHAGLDQAFRLRSLGLDTIYLFSDGLPTSGPGLSAEQTRSLNDVQKSEVLGRYLRDTLKSDWNRAIGGARVKVNAIGFFYESPDVGAFLWALSRENNGSFVGMSRP